MKKHYWITVTVLFVLAHFLCTAQIQFEKGAAFKMLKGSQAGSLPANWMTSGFDDGIWPEAPAPFRYGDGSGGTLLSDMRNGYSTLYLRSQFRVSHLADLKTVSFDCSFDDGFILWINGKEAIRNNAPENPTSESYSPVNHEWDTPFVLELSAGEMNLLEGENLLAVQVFNATLGSSDFYFDLSIDARPELPILDATGKELTFSHTAGFCPEPFNLEIQSGDPNLGIAFTLDGSNPQTSSSVQRGGSTVTIRVDPASSEGNRGQTPAFVVRASLWKEGFAPAFPTAATYIFLQKVFQQSHPGGEWPSRSVNRQRIDYDMAADVVGNPQYQPMLEQALLEIPSISLSTDLENLFGSSKGIYVNAAQKGEEWERECSIELIHPTGKEGFQVNAGVRIRGGNSAKNSDNPKHAFRLFFREEYGEAKLHYPLFGSRGAGEFDCIDLRCEQNYSWSMDGDAQNTMVKDIYCRDLQGLMGHPSAKGENYHLYLNGMYWGIFQTDERPEASFAESYLGGDKEDYDVVKVNTQPWPYFNEATDGTLDSWDDLWNLCTQGFASNERYFYLEGKNPNGEHIHDARVWVDIDNLIDYLLIIFYSGNFDAPVSAWSGNDMPNNFFAIFNRENRSQGFRFVAHDSEHCMFVGPKYIGVGLEENRVNIGSNGQMRITRMLDFNPQWLHHKLTSNAEYRLRFADRASRYLSKGGLLSPDLARACFEKRVGEIDTAIVAESARWGDAQKNSSLTRNNHWLPEIQNLYDNYFPYRTSIVIDQLKAEGLYSSLALPEIRANGAEIRQHVFLFSGGLPIEIQRPGSTGELIYSLDGSDPRLPGGRLSEQAVVAGSQVALNLSSSVLIRARIRSGQEWGPEQRVFFRKEQQDYSSLKVTELHYHPRNLIDGVDTIDHKNLEFIELKNTGTEVLDLSGLTLDSAVYFRFPEQTLLFPGQYYVIASKPNSFFLRYNRYPEGNFSGQFSNGSEWVLLTDASGKEIFSFTYFDRSPWPEEADGAGYSLVSAEENPTGDPNHPGYWKASSLLDGSPFESEREALLAEEKVAAPTDSDVQVYPNPASRYIRVSAGSSFRDQNVQVSCYDLTGRRVFCRVVPSGSTIDLQSLALNERMYLVHIVAGGETFQRKLIMLPE